MTEKKKKFILWFKEITKKDVPLVGGKNASLGEMFSKLTKKGINVPGGFVLTSKAYWHFLRENGIDRKLKELFQKFNPKSLTSLQETGKEARKLILQGDFPDDLRKEILRNYKKLSKKYAYPLLTPPPPERRGRKEEREGIKDIDVAVRSSATAEDLPSIAGNEMVLARTGNEMKYLEVEKLFEKLKENPQPTFVPSLANNGKIKWIKIKELYQHPVKNKVLYKITTKSGREITITSDHSLIALDPDEFKSKVTSINKVDKNTRIPVIKHLPLIGNGQKIMNVKDAIKSRSTLIENGRVKINQKNTLKEQYGLPAEISIDKEFAYFLGIYLAEGSIYEKRNCIDISCDATSVLDRVRKFYRSIDSYKCKKRNYKRKVRIQNATLAALLQDITGKPLPIKGKGRSARAKYVPEFIFTQPKEIISEFLKGLFDGDGWVDEKGIYYCSLSKKLIGGMVKLLEMFGMKYYIGKKCTVITIPASNAEKFKKLINFSENKNRKRLEKLIYGYKKREKHQDFIETIPPSKKISELLEEKLKPVPKLEKVKTLICPKCSGETVGGGVYSDYRDEKVRIKRYFCKNCGSCFSERTPFPLKKKTILKHIYYDKLGRFKKGMTPWNKGNRKRLITYGISYLRKIAKKIKSKELLNIVNSDIIWDKIKKIEPIKYSGYVYDFVVPQTQNFAAGVGGIITHNSASFAGQHETFLNVRGEKQLLQAIKKCMASLFTNRAIAYREEKKFEHLKIALSVGVQKMVRSDLASSGVIFTLDTETGFRNVVLINSIYGVGELLVKGQITPDEFYVFKPTLKEGYESIIVKNLGRKNRKYIYNKEGGLKEVAVPEDRRLKFSLTDDEILALARWACLIEEHYQYPQDIEWAKDGKTGELFIVQSRPETVHAPKESKVYQEYQLKPSKEPILTGIAIGAQIGTGRVSVIPDVARISQFKKGDVLVTKMTNPDWVAVMRLASAIVTDEGSKVCHAAIVARELGIPAVVGTVNGTRILKPGQEVTVDCTQGLHGRIYPGKVPFKIKKYNLKKIPKLKTKIMVNIGAPEIAFKTSFLPQQGVGLVREEFIIAEKIKVHPLALIHYNELKRKFSIFNFQFSNKSQIPNSKIQKIIKQIDEMTVEHKDKKEYFVKELAEGIGQIAAAFWPKPVIVRFSDFKTNEYRQLLCGELFEPEEANPMLGWRGASRYYDEKFKPAFLMECEAMRRVRSVFGLKNVKVMVPFCRTIEEGKKVLELMRKAGLEKGKDGLDVYVMCEIPSNVILTEQFLEIFDGMSIGSNDLTQLVLGIDRDNGNLQKIGDERNEAVKQMLAKVIKICKEKNKYCGICGQAPSDFPDFAEFLIKEGIESISLNPDTVVKTILKLSQK